MRRWVKLLPSVLYPGLRGFLKLLGNRVEQESWNLKCNGCVPGYWFICRIVNGEFTGVNKPSVSPRKPIKEDKGAGKKRQNKKAPETFLPPLSQTNQELMATTAVFKFIELLPHHTLLSKAATQAAQPRGPRTMFTDAEDNLLALGMAQFDRDFKLIHEHLLPAKSPKQLQIRCKNKSASRAPENVIRHFRYTKELWRMPREISNKLAPGKRRSRSCWAEFNQVHKSSILRVVP